MMQRLSTELQIRTEQRDKALARVEELQAKVSEQEGELARLRRGDFTPEEFQNLCHNIDVQAGRECFEAGCREYQERLFGKKETP